MTQKRKYTKRNKDYWDSRSTQQEQQAHIPSEGEIFAQNVWASDMEDIQWQEEGFAAARRTSGATQTRIRDNQVGTSVNPTRFSNIAVLGRPFKHNSGGVVDIGEAISLCQKAYDNVAIVRNTVESMVEFAASEMYLEGGTAQSRKFFDAWLKEIGQNNLAEQFFREYYRSSNIFFHRLEGEVSEDTMKKMRRVPRKVKIPIRYILLNPVDISRTPSTIYQDSSLVKALSAYEIQRLKNPQNDGDQRAFNALPEKTKELIKGGSYTKDGVYMDLPNAEIISCFGFKQDYEPFGVPYLYPVLDPLNWKMLYQKMDEQLARTVENVILLVTHGAEPDKGGINPLVIQSLQNIFRNRSVGRTLVADYTTKADFVIPDLEKVIGPEKYKVVDDDIKDGLQNLMIGSEKFGNLQTKAQLFLERIKSVRTKYLNDFLIPEMERVAKNMGFRALPTPKFVEISLQDKAGVQRVVTRLLELGILHPEDGIEAIQKNVYPNPEKLKASQVRYLEERKKGLYNPLVGGVPSDEAVEAVKLNKGAPKKALKKPNGRPVEKASVAGMKEFCEDMTKLESYINTCLTKTFGKKVTTEHTEASAELCKEIILSTSKEEWGSTCKDCLQDFNQMKNLKVKPEIEGIAAQYGLDYLSAAILYHSN